MLCHCLIRPPHGRAIANSDFLDDAFYAGQNNLRPPIGGPKLLQILEEPRGIEPLTS